MPAEAVEPINAARERLFKLIEQTHNLDWMLLTKRPENVMDMIPVRWKTRCTFKREPANRIPKNVWIGTTVENQKYADERIPELLNIPAKVRFLSVEPMLGPVDLSFHLGLAKNHEDLRGLINLVIAGGESGSKARPMHPDWPRSLRDQCVAADVSFFFKQWGEWFSPLQISTKEIHSSKIIWPDGTTGGGSAYEHGGFGSHVINVGKKNAGRLLDGRTWDEMPNDKTLPAHAL
jgi:protein gp37